MKYDNLPQEPIHHESYDLGYKQGKVDAFEDVLDRLDEGVCEYCEHGSEKCFKICAKNGYEMEALKIWLKEQKGE